MAIDKDGLMRLLLFLLLLSSSSLVNHPNITFFGILSPNIEWAIDQNININRKEAH
jgi:hypothetical protein